MPVTFETKDKFPWYIMSQAAVRFKSKRIDVLLSSSKVRTSFEYEEKSGLCAVLGPVSRLMDAEQSVY